MTCTDVNECSTDNAGCGAEACTNTAGSYACNAVNCGEYTAPDSATVSPTGNIVAPNSVTITCNTGYSLSGSSTATCGSDASFSTGGTCSEVNECATSNGGCDSNAGCVNNVGSYSCSCDTGYTGDGMSCTEVNECATTNGGCDSNAACSNTAGSFECVCDSAYSGDGITCTAIPQAGCDPVTDCNSNGKCGTLGVCVCDAGYVDSNCAQYSAPAATVSVTVPANTAATASVGSAAAIVFPAGAVTSAVVVSGEAYSTNASTTSVSASAMPDGLTLDGAGAPHCVFGPAGLTFSVPVVVNMSYDPTAVNANEVQPFLRNETSGGWMSLSAGDFLYVDEANGVIVIQVHHFSTYTAYKVTPVAPSNPALNAADDDDDDSGVPRNLILVIVPCVVLFVVCVVGLIVYVRYFHNRNRHSSGSVSTSNLKLIDGYGEQWNLEQPPTSPPYGIDTTPNVVSPPDMHRVGSSTVSGFLETDTPASPVGFVDDRSHPIGLHLSDTPTPTPPPLGAVSPQPPRSPALLEGQPMSRAAGLRSKLEPLHVKDHAEWFLRHQRQNSIVDLLARAEMERPQTPFSPATADGATPQLRFLQPSAVASPSSGFSPPPTAMSEAALPHWEPNL